MRNSTTSTWRLFWRVCLGIHQLENAAVGGCIHPGFRDPTRKYLVAFVARVDFYQQGMKSPVCRIFNTAHDRTRRDLVLAQAFFASRSECKLNLLQQSSFSVPFFSKQSFSHIQKRSCTRHSTSSFIRVLPQRSQAKMIVLHICNLYEDVLLPGKYFCRKFWSLFQLLF